MSEFLEELLDGFDELDEKKSDTPKKDTIVCPKCEATLDSDAVECYECGALIATDVGVVQPVLCKICDEVIFEGIKKCPSCGTPVDIDLGSLKGEKSTETDQSDEEEMPKENANEEEIPEHGKEADENSPDMEEVSEEKLEASGELPDDAPEESLDAFNALTDTSSLEPEPVVAAEEELETEEPDVAEDAEAPEPVLPVPVAPVRVKKVKMTVASEPLPKKDPKTLEKARKKAEKLLKKGKITQEEFDAMFGLTGTSSGAESEFEREDDVTVATVEAVEARPEIETSAGSEREAAGTADAQGVGEEYLSSRESDITAQIERLKDREEALSAKEKELEQVENELKALAEAMDGQSDGKEIIDLQASILGTIMKKNTQIVLEVVKELDISADDIRRLT